MKLAALFKLALSSAAMAVIPWLPAQAQQSSAADNYPNRPITLVVGFGTGGSTDIVARALADVMAQDLGQTVVVENRPGANGMMATRQLAAAQPDGYTLLFTLSPHVTNALLYDNVKFDLFEDFEYISEVARTPAMMVAHPDLPANNINELIALAKRSDVPLSYGSPGVGSTYALAMDMLTSKTGVEFTHVPYKGNAPAFVDLIAGRLSMMLSTLSMAIPLLEDGRVKPIGLATHGRMEDLLPGVPTLNESIEGFEVDIWQGVLAPGGTPREIVKKLNDSMVRAVNTPKLQAILKESNIIPTGSTSEEFVATVKSDYKVWSELVKSAGLKIE